MGFTAKTKSSITENWGMGFLLVFFPEETRSASSTSDAAAATDNSNFVSSSSSSPVRSMRRSNSSNPIISKAQSTISICALYVFLTLLLFTLSTFEPTTSGTAATTTISSRRLLSRKIPIINSTNQFPSFALHGMGTLFRRGTRAMNDLLVAHLDEDVKEDHFRLFLKTLHRSGLTARADVVLIFHGSSRFGDPIREENDSFFKLVRHYRELKGASRNSSFDLAQFVKNEKKEMGGEPLWGKRFRSNYSEVGEEENEFAGLSYGSVVGFESGELDPESSLSGFLDPVPMSLRRWACYPMLLGRVRRNFKHVILVDVKNSVILGDPLVRVRNRSPESVYITKKQESKHRNSDKTQSHHEVNPTILMGGTRGIRRLSNAMLTEIVRAAMQRKKKNSVSESVILSQLISNEYILKNVDLIKPTESIPEASSLTGLSRRALSDYPIIQSGNEYHDINYIVKKLICSSEVDFSVYRDC